MPTHNVFPIAAVKEFEEKNNTKLTVNIGVDEALHPKKAATANPAVPRVRGLGIKCVLSTQPCPCPVGRWVYLLTSATQ
jgi:hypothetical protein